MSMTQRKKNNRLACLVFGRGFISLCVCVFFFKSFLSKQGISAKLSRVIPNVWDRQLVKLQHVKAISALKISNDVIRAQKSGK